jgi:hypothetical protein
MAIGGDAAISGATPNSSNNPFPLPVGNPDDWAKGRGAMASPDNIKRLMNEFCTIPTLLSKQALRSHTKCHKCTSITQKSPLHRQTR